MASANNQFKSSEDRRRTRELEEARKAGLAPAAVDEEGKEINPHIPQYMASTPWYLASGSDAPTLKHQRDWREKGGDTLASSGMRARVARTAPPPPRFKKGACANCGSTTHTAKYCMERPRARGAAVTGRVTASAPDAVVVDTRTTFDATRDRWEGYDPADHARVVELHEKVEAAKAAAKRAAELEKKFGKGKDGDTHPSSSDDGSDSDADGDGDRVAATADAPFVKVEKAVRTAGGGASGTVRNLRIREDTAKYLTDLRPDAPHYDPKSRSMRGGEAMAAAAGGGPASALALPGGGDFVRPSSDADGFAAVAAHAAAAFERGHDVNAFAAPSQAAALAAAFKAKKAALDAAAKGAVTAAYGNAAAPLDEEARALLTGQTEAYVEYSGATGRPLAGAPPPAVSRYEEDVFPGNHTSVWGSWFEVGTKQWGYACCHATARGAYCLGEAGRRAAVDAAADTAANLAAAAARLAARRAVADAVAAKGTARPRAPPPGEAAALWGGSSGGGGGGDDAPALDESKLAAAIAAEESRSRKRGVGGGSPDGGGSAPITAEEVEAYRLKRARADDPTLRRGGGAGKDGYDYV